MAMRTLRILLVIQIVSLVIVAAIHAGILMGGPFESAAMYEAGVAVILAVGLALTYAGRTVARWAALVAQVKTPVAGSMLLPPGVPASRL